MITLRNKRLLKKIVVFGTVWLVVVVILNPPTENMSESLNQDIKSVFDFFKSSASRQRDILESLSLPTPPNVFGVDGLGENGKPVVMPENLSPDIQQLYDDGWKNHEFNQYLSDLISWNRSLPDHRSDYCRKITRTYSRNLPTTSVIFVFHNEAWSTLIRSIHSVLNKSPPHLLTEIILVDDFSDMDHLKKPLDLYISQFPKVKIIRAQERIGLIKARIIGAVSAKSQTLTFLDSHIECIEGWLEPLLDRIAQDPTNVACPVIDMIHFRTFEYIAEEIIKIGGFFWTVIFTWRMVPEREILRRKDQSEPIRTPTMAGGLFTIDKAFFEKLGMYDPDFDIWGAENLELSFKTWMCGGTLEVIPCSRVGHIFRKKTPYKWRDDINPMIRNTKRLAAVWMDDYAKHFYIRTRYKPAGYGDVSDRIKLRESLGCKSFKWYLQNVYPGQYDPSFAQMQGNIQSIALNKEFCIANELQGLHKPVPIEPCIEAKDNQFFWFTQNNELRRDDMCFDYPGKGKFVLTMVCNHQKTTQFFTYIPETNQIYNKHSKKCLSLSDNNLLLTAEKCMKNRTQQKWILNNYDIPEVL